MRHLKLSIQQQPKGRPNWLLCRGGRCRDFSIRATRPGGHSLVMGYWGCAAGWGHIFTTRLTIMGSPIQAFSIELLEWGVALFRDFESKKIICPKVTKMGFIIGRKIDQK